MITTTLLLSIALLSCSAALDEHRQAPLKEGTVAVTQDEKVRIHPIHHSALVLEWNKLVVYVDPHGSADRFKKFPPPDLILVTDIHGDHLDPATLAALDRSRAVIIAPPAVMEQLPAELKRTGRELRNGATTEVKQIGIEAVPMYNLPDTNDARHPKGRGNGYVLTMGDERIYISGDTEDIKEMRALRGIDIAFVCMNLPYTMTVDKAASAVLEFKPRVVYPYHYRGQDGFSDVKRFQQLVNNGDPKIEVRLEDWYKE